MNLKQKTIEKIDALHQYLRELEELLPEEKEYLQDLTVRRACEKTVELAIEQVISIASLIVSGQKLGVPHSEDDLVTLLERKKILTPKTAKKIREMKGFRNILVHKYGEINDKLTYEYLANELDDFDIFEKEIRKFLKRLG